MHALVDAAHVDHLHPDSGIAFATAKDGAKLTAKAFGGRVRLGAVASSRVPARPRHRGDQGEESGCRSAASWAATASPRGAPRARRPRRTRSGSSTTAAAYIDEERDEEPVRASRARRTRALKPAERRAKAAALAPTIRGLASHDRPMVGHFTDDPRVLDFLASADAPRLAALGTSCPDHFLRTKVKPMLLDLPAAASVEDSIARLEGAAREVPRRLHDVLRASTPSRGSPAMRGADPLDRAACPGSACSATARTSRPRGSPASSTSTRST